MGCGTCATCAACVLAAPWELVSRRSPGGRENRGKRMQNSVTIVQDIDKSDVIMYNNDNIRNKEEPYSNSESGKGARRWSEKLG